VADLFVRLPWAYPAWMTNRSAGHAGPAVAQPNPFVGREHDLARLVAAYEAATAGSPRIELIAGEEGIGKTRLVSELGSAVVAAGGRVMVGGCLDLADGGLPLLPLAEALRGLARSTPWPELEEMLGPVRPQLARLVPALGEDGSATDEPLATARMEEGVLAILGRLAADRPTLLVFEDVHWIDRASRDLVTFLARNLATEPMLLVLTCRTEDVGTETDRWLTELARQPRVERLEIGRLNRESVRAQMVAILGSEPDPRSVDRTWRRSDGNPYFVEELATAGDDPPPPTLAASVTGRLALLSPRTREIVRIVAVGGRSIDEELLVAVADRSAADVRDALHEAVERRVLLIDDDGRIGFRHALVREVAAAELLPGERRELHERLASVLSVSSELAEPSPAGAAAELAYHWEGAGRPDEALEAAIDAGAAAARVAAWADADRQYERALRLADAAQLPEGVDRVELLRRAAEAAELSGDFPRAQVLVDGALAAAEKTGERVALLHARHGYLRWATTMAPWRRMSRASRCSPKSRRVPRGHASSDRSRVRSSGSVATRRAARRHPMALPVPRLPARSRRRREHATSLVRSSWPLAMSMRASPSSSSLPTWRRRPVRRTCASSVHTTWP
jgi:predicted ATPase